MLDVPIPERMQSLLDEVFEDHHPVLGVGAVLMPEDLEKGNVSLKVLAYNGGRIASMIHKPSGYEWMEEGFKNGGYEEFSGTEFRSSGWNESYTVVKYGIEHLSHQFYFMSFSCSVFFAVSVFRLTMVWNVKFDSSFELICF